MKKLKVAIFTDSFLPLLNGITTSTISLVKGLAERGHKVYVIAPNYKNLKEFKYPNVTIKRVPGITAFFYPGFKFTSPFSTKLTDYLKKQKIDLVHFQTPFTLGLQAILVSKKLNKPLVGTFHTFIADEQYLKHGGINLKFLQPLSWSFVRKFYNKCDLITCPSESTKLELVKNRFIKPLKVVSNGIDLNSFNNSKWNEARKRYNLNNKTLLFVGRIAYEKNLDYLLDCFKLVTSKIPDAKLLVVGDGPQMEEFKKKIEILELSENVVLTGSIEHKKLVKSGIFKACKIFVTASKTESQGITILEAQANGLVCVGLNARGTKDLIKNGCNGYLVEEGNKKEFANKVIGLLKNEALYLKMSKNTSVEIKKHDLKKVIGEWEAVYFDLNKVNKISSINL